MEGLDPNGTAFLTQSVRTYLLYIENQVALYCILKTVHNITIAIYLTFNLYRTILFYITQWTVLLTNLAVSPAVSLAISVVVSSTVASGEVSLATSAAASSNDDITLALFASFTVLAYRSESPYGHWIFSNSFWNSSLSFPSFQCNIVIVIILHSPPLISHSPSQYIGM